MFLIERFVGFGTYMAILLVACLFLIKTTASCKSVLRVYLVCLCVMAYCYKPYVTADLYRIYETMDFFSSMSFSVFWSEFALESTSPVARLIYWAIGKTGNNALLPVFSAFVCYSIIFWIINKTKEKYAVSKFNVACVLFFVMTTSIYISVIGGIRMMLSLCLILFSYFRVTVEKKFGLIDVLFCVSALFIHAMGYAVIGICALVFAVKAIRGIERKSLYLGIIGVVGIVFFVKFRDVVNRLYRKFLEYVLGDRHSDSWEYIMGVLIVAVLMLLFFEFRRLRNEEDVRTLEPHHSAAVLSVVVAMCFCFEFSFFYRFGGQLAVLLSIPTMMVTLEKRKGKSGTVIRGVDFRSVLILFSLIIAVLSCTRGSLSSLKFFEL